MTLTITPLHQKTLIVLLHTIVYIQTKAQYTLQVLLDERDCSALCVFLGFMGTYILKHCINYRTNVSNILISALDFVQA